MFSHQIKMKKTMNSLRSNTNDSIYVYVVNQNNKKSYIGESW